MKDEKNIKGQERTPEANREQPQHERAMDDPGRGHGDPMDDLLPDDKGTTPKPQR